MRHSNLPLAAIVAFVMMTLLVVPVPEAAAGLSQELQCRADIDRASRRYIERVHRVRQRCLRKVFRGALPLATDCITGDGDADTQTRIEELRGRVGAIVPKHCTRANMAELGYPGRCRDTNPPSNSFDVNDLESCIIDIHDEAITHMLELEYPPEQALPGRFVRCVAGAARRAADMVRLEVRARHRCLFANETKFLQDDSCREPMPPYGAGTGDERADGRILRSYVGLLSGIPVVCNGVDLDFLGYTDDCVDDTQGRFNSFDLKLCIFNDHRQIAADSVEVAYPADPVCGDGDVEGDEECDDGNDIDTDACLNSCLVARCGDGSVHAGVEDCDDGNSSDGDACKNDCKANVCGDAIVNVGVEDCDDGNSSDSDACRNNCENAACGDGVTCLAAGCSSGPNGSFEDCDDGNVASGDGCSSECGIEFCGDGVVNNNNEECDDGLSNGSGPNQCRALSCKLPSCGDGVVDDSPEFGEQCEPPGTLTCGGDCRFLLCGNGVVDVDAGEECDDGAGNSNTAQNACREDCTEPFCGDGKLDDQFGEQCEPVDGVDCLAGCVLPNCGNGTLEPQFGEECDDGAANSDTAPDACRTDCSSPSCGDSVADSGEQCDDGNGSDTDACKNDCSNNVCGDAVVYNGVEACDDGNTVDTDACKNDCSDNVCGDGVVYGGVEDCDNGAANSDTNPDACRASCVLPSCGDGVIDPSLSEQCDDGAANSDTTADACRSDCTTPVCGDGVADSSEECDGADDSVCQAQGSSCGGACACINECPAFGEAVLFSGTGIECSSDADCGPGTCVSGRCHTVTNLDTGWTGLGHNSDITDRVAVRALLECGTTFPCGECAITGIDPAPGNCRCENDNQAVCMKPFQVDNDSCGGDVCNCYLGPPLDLSAGGTPVCVVNRIASDIAGTGNVDLGQGVVSADLASKVFLGESLFQPCPACVGDITPNDGLKEGICDLGENKNGACDANALNTTFPAPGGGQHSLDCFPLAGKNVSGTGLKIAFTQSTGRVELGPAAIACDPFPPIITDSCLCGLCTGDPTFSTVCSSDAECAAAGVGGTCSTVGVGPSPLPHPNACGAAGCVDVDGNGIHGECPDKTSAFCDGLLRANGDPFVTCISDGDCAANTIGRDAGLCTIVTNRPCFLDVVVAEGKSDPSAPASAATFCIPPTGNQGINGVAGLPGPGRVVTQTAVRTFCKSDPAVEYIPGVGGCN